MDLLFIVELVRSYLRSGWDWTRRYWLAAVVFFLIDLAARSMADAGQRTPWDILLTSAIAALISANAFWWWYHDREQQARSRFLTYQRDMAWQDIAHLKERAALFEETTLALIAKQDVDRAEIATTLAKRIGGQA